MSDISYSSDVKKIQDEEDRARVGQQILTILKYHLGNLSRLTCLDVGCSQGIISKILADNFLKVVGIDVDDVAINNANKNIKKKNLSFIVMDGTKLDFAGNSFDVVVCNQVYNFSLDPKKLLIEINRILKPGGVCFFGARNKFAFWEPQYDLPLLSMMPLKLAEFIIRLLGKGQKYHSRYLSYFGIRKLVKDFNKVDYTIKVMQDPHKFGFKKLIKWSFLFKLIPSPILVLLQPIFPNYIWLLSKRG